MSVATFPTTTPRFSYHAKLRCAEMGLTTKEVKRVWRTACLDYPGPNTHGANRLRVGDEIAIAYKVIDGRPLVCTVLWNYEFERPES